MKLPWRSKIASWDIWLGYHLPPKVVFAVLMRVYQDYLRVHGYGNTDHSLERALVEWGKKARPLPKDNQ